MKPVNCFYITEEMLLNAVENIKLAIYVIIYSSYSDIWLALFYWYYIFKG